MGLDRQLVQFPTGGWDHILKRGLPLSSERNEQFEGPKRIGLAKELS